MLIATGVTQVIAANDLPSGLWVLNDLPQKETVFLIIGGIFAFSLTWLSLKYEKWYSGGAALVAAGLYSSVIFFRISAVKETGLAYSVLAGFLFIAMFGLRAKFIFLTKIEQLFLKATVFFIFFLLVATILSPVPGQSYTYVLYIFVMIFLAMLVSLKLETYIGLKTAAWIILFFGAGLPVVFAIIEAIGIYNGFDINAVLLYRLHPTEMGGANLIARSVLVGAPFGVALLLIEKSLERLKWIYKATLILLEILILVVIIYALSWEGFFAWLVAFSFFVILVCWKKIQVYWSTIATRFVVRVAIIACVILIITGVLFVGFRLAPSLNPYSFNGRFAHWVGAISAINRHPFLGGGPDNEYLYSMFANNVALINESQGFIDDPLSVINFRSGILKLHGHNLVLETIAFTGLIGFVSAAVMLCILIWIGFMTWKQGNPVHKVIAAACLAGIFGELAWSMLDVMRETPPFFSFPVWAIIGLLLATFRVSRSKIIETKRYRISNFESKPSRIFFGFVLIIVFLPALASNQYSSGFLAFQEHRWQDAAKNFQIASVVNPLSAHYRWMLSKVDLEIGQTKQATENIEKAISLKRGYSPYLTQAGWLAWLQGDLESTNAYFEEAIANDPLEGWTPGLHANLGLLRANQGRWSEAYELFAKSFEYHPDLAGELYWLKIQLADGTFAVVLDPVYYRESLAADLNIRLMSHLGKSNITARQFNQSLNGGDYLNIDSVFDVLNTHYLSGKNENDPEAHLILAAGAEAARLSGLYDRAEDAYLNYQTVRPNSAYGYRGMALIYSEQNRFDEAQLWLEKAVDVSPKNIDSKRLLSLVQLNLQEPDKAAETLSLTTAIASSDSFHLMSFNVDILDAWQQVYSALGESEKARQALEWISKIRATPEDFLALANDDSIDGTSIEKTGNCWKAYDALVKNWVRPYDSRLWSVATCIAKSGENEKQIEIHIDSVGSDFIHQIMLGHIARLRNQPEKAVENYFLATESRKNESAPHYFLGETYLLLNMTEDAEKEFFLAANLDPYESLPLLALGRLYESKENYSDALAAYQEAVARTPGWGEAQLAMGNYYLKSGNFSEAVPYFGLAQKVEGNIFRDTVYDFVSNLAKANLSDTVYKGFIKATYFQINGDRKTTIFMHPDSFAEYEINLPVLKTGEELYLNFWTGLSPEVWNQAGDGVNFVIILEDGINSQEIFSTYMDPKQNIEDRNWRLEKINLSAYQGKGIKLKFMTTSGPNNDDRFDWAGWGDPAIIIDNHSSSVP
ncbi:MAG: tetratricopeptide repeat protein [Anaerolineaceae bacterium]